MLIILEIHVWLKIIYLYFADSVYTSGLKNMKKKEKYQKNRYNKIYESTLINWD